MSEVTKRIDSVLREKGISKKEFYKACKITSSAYSQWNTGKTEPRTTKIKEISNYLNVMYEWLAFGIGEKEKSLSKIGEGDHAIDHVDDELKEYLDELRNRSEMRMLFSTTKNATKAQIEAIVKMIEEMQGEK